MIIYRCEGKPYPSFQCADLSDETKCDFEPQPLVNNPALMSLEYDKQSQCFKQAFTFAALNETVLQQNYPDKNMREFALKYEFSPLKTAAVISLGVNIGLTLLCVLLLLCIGCVTNRCKSMRALFIVLSVIYILCLCSTLFVGSFWVSYVTALNEVVENSAESDIYERVAIETIKVTGGFASVRISTNLIFYNCGFFGLAIILSIVAAHLVKTASCHRQISYKERYHPAEYPDDPLTTHKLLSGNHSTANSETSTATPEQRVYLQPSFRSIQKQFMHSASDSELRKPQASPHSNTYISYGEVDSIDAPHGLSATLHHIGVQTLDKSPRQTQV